MATGPADLTTSAVVPDPAARRGAALLGAVALVTLVVPGLLGVTQRPDDALEGWVALGLGVLALVWQARRAATAGLAVTPGGLGRRGWRARTVPWPQVQTIRFTTLRVHDRRRTASAPGSDVLLHHLDVEGDGQRLRITRRPLTDADRARVERSLHAVGLRWEG